MASESGGWLNQLHVIPGRGCVVGVVGSVVPVLPGWSAVKKVCVNRSGLGWSAVVGESHVGENMFSAVMGSRVAAGP